MDFLCRDGVDAHYQLVDNFCERFIFTFFGHRCDVSMQSNRNRTVLRLKREIYFRIASAFDEKKTAFHQFAHRNKNSFSSFPDYFSTPSTQHAATSFSIEYLINVVWYPPCLIRCIVCGCLYCDKWCSVGEL